MKGRIFLFMQLLHLAVSLSKSSTDPPASNLLPKTCGYSPLSAIYRGTKTYLGTYSWMAALGYRNALTNKIDFRCGGSVISERYVLTAATCVTSMQPEVIRLGEWDLATDLDCETTDSGFSGFQCAPEPAQDFQYEEIVSHPAYNTRAQISDDIALIRLTKPIDFEGKRWIQPVCLPELDFDVQATVDHRRPVVTSWGFAGNVSNILLQEHLSNVDVESCNVTYYRGRLVEEQMCFGGVESDLCGGDSGSPLMSDLSSSSTFTQIGIVSYGPHQCGRNGVPVVYTSVAKYRDWIEQTLRQ